MNWLLELTLFSWILILGLVVNLAFLIGLLLDKEKRKIPGRKILSLIVGAFSLLIAESLTRSQFSTSIFGLAIAADYLIAPMIYFYALSMVNRQKLKTMRIWPHFVPFALTLLAVLPLAYTFGPNWLFLIGEENEKYVFYWALTKPVFYVGYLWASLKAFSNARPFIRAREKKAFTRFVYIYRGVLVFIFLLFTEFALFNLGWEWLPLPDKISFIFAALTIYLTGFFAFRNDRFLSGFTLRQENSTSKAGQEILNFVEKEKPYLDPELTLSRLASQIGFSKTKVSDILVNDLGTTFYALLNDFRLREFKALVQIPENRKRPILNLAFDAGFNSKAAFYRAFKKQEGKPPKDFRKDIKAKSSH